MFGSMPINKSFDTLTSEQRKEADQLILLVTMFFGVGHKIRL